jgi:NADPH-dependent curcumin reductase CurA
VEELGFDACVDHRAGDLEGQLQEVLPRGLDVYFDNVGGSHLRAALTLANPFARFVECGQISAYNGVVEPVDNLFLIVGKKLTVRGFIVWDSATASRCSRSTSPGCCARAGSATTRRS